MSVCQTRRAHPSLSGSRSGAATPLDGDLTPMRGDTPVTNMMTSRTDETGNITYDSLIDGLGLLSADGPGGPGGPGPSPLKQYLWDCDLNNDKEASRWTYRGRETSTEGTINAEVCNQTDPFLGIPFTS